ncbi:MAG TPA: TatD family hydrolase [Candidatus Egerieimonas intestinavium]|uniref:TatD family hydrolase n=1 Tax=Candidatus Egerieimonas intestinavium TaxID=2840777 RepID=A0A9D1ELM2_9FIRM|nr:TatD family hydrolase [Candidatus Egerieimonas intestinavium]
MIFESHAHYDDEAFDGDREELLHSLSAQGVGTVINVAASVDGIESTVRLAEEYPFVYAAVGVHPDEVGEMDQGTLERMRRLAREDKVVAIGEIGLDYYWDKEKHELQKEWFRRQLDVARQEKLPFIIHSREAAADTLQVAREERVGEIGGVVHCFSYGVELAREYLNMGLYLGIGGVVTFKNARKLKEVAEYAPLSALLLETDSPYLAPVPHRGKRNDSGNLPLVAQAIGEIKGISPEEVIRVTEENGRRLFYKIDKNGK